MPTSIRIKLDSGKIFRVRDFVPKRIDDMYKRLVGDQTDSKSGMVKVTEADNMFLIEMSLPPEVEGDEPKIDKNYLMSDECDSREMNILLEKIKDLTDYNDFSTEELAEIDPDDKKAMRKLYMKRQLELKKKATKL